ncbi:MAG: ABC transporter ATP-binding protein/permease [Oscillospiraceae bacterium]|nr:ABC transporter ATP-binding protein/permease [Oscillospiraceae bacterium]MCL2279801.1 ABC transporter ATP-binding protein/permease [Oscillospiraceae bacterium]
MREICLRHKSILLISILFAFLTTATMVGYAFLFQFLVDYIVALDLSGALLATGGLILIFLLSATFSFLRGVFKNKYFRATFLALKNKMFEVFMNSDYLKFYEKAEGDYLNTMTTLMDDLKTQYMLPLYAIVTSSALAIFSLMAVFFYSYIMGFVAILLLLVQVSIPLLFKKATSNASAKYVKTAGDFSGSVANYLGGFELFASRSLQSEILSKFSDVNERLENSKLKRNNLLVGSNSVIYLIRMLLILIPWVVGAILIIQGQITLGAMMAISQLNNSIAEPFSEVIENYNLSISGKEVAKKIDGDITKHSRQKALLELKNELKKIEVENLSFTYGGEIVLNRLSVTFEAGKKYAIYGASGSGKSTLAKILAGLLTGYSGRILFNGDCISAEHYNLSKFIGYLPQETYLLNDSLINNVSLYQDIDGDSIISILNNLGLSEMVSTLEFGVDTNMGNAGQFVSSGQKQRIGLARILTSNLPVIIFDEPTSSVDADTKMNIEKYILSLDGVTVINITHSIDDGLKEEYDHLLRIDEGKIIPI